MHPSPSCSQLPGYRLQVACNFSQVRQAARSVRGFLADQGCSEEEVVDWEFAVVEACNNAVKYVAPAAANLPIDLEVYCAPEEVEIRVIDHTPGFDWPDKAVLPAPESESGRGIFLIQSITDYASYRRGTSDNVLVMRKRRSLPKVP
jgi:anti-sigma regulatory factor (Ser/Thr protein kinase)